MTDHGRVVDLEVTGVNHDSGRRVDRDAHRVGDRVTDTEPLGGQTADSLLTAARPVANIVIHTVEEPVDEQPVAADGVNQTSSTVCMTMFSTGRAAASKLSVV